MREKHEVLEKFNEMRILKLKERKEQFLSRHPRNCFFNFQQRIKENGLIGFCQNPDVIKTIGTKVFVCNDCETVSRCMAFRCRNTEQSVEKEFEATLRSPARCGQEYPKLAILIWFLQDYSSTRLARFGRVFASIGMGIYRLIFFKWW